MLGKIGSVGDKLCQSVNDYKSGGICYGLFLAQKIKYCLTIDNYCIIQEHKTFEGFNDPIRLLDHTQFFEMIEVKLISAVLPKIWKKSVNTGAILPTKMRFCNEFKDKTICDSCNI